jgi:hypothetical protein
MKVLMHALAASCEELRARTGNPPLHYEKHCFAQSVCNCILLNDISDHLPIIAVFADEQIPNKTPEEVAFRDFNNANQETFMRCLDRVDWFNILNDREDLNELFANFLSEHTKHYETCFPFKRVKRNNQIPKTPWISSGLLVSVRKKIGYIGNLLISQIQ